jgi:hypothetical protein
MHSADSSNYKLPKYSACFRNEQCWSGFCSLRNRCKEPEKIHDPCRPLIENCPGNLVCSEWSRTCVPVDYHSKANSFCKFSSDCKHTEICWRGSCRKALQIGFECQKQTELCVQGSKCTQILSSSNSKCLQLCSAESKCPYGFECKPDTFDPSVSVCIGRIIDHNTHEGSNSHRSQDLIEATLLVAFVLVLLLAILYGWIRFTKSGIDPRFLHNSKSKKKKKKKLRLNYDSNGLATITVIPSNCQSPLPVAAADLFSGAPCDPPAYAEVISIPPR